MRRGLRWISWALGGVIAILLLAALISARPGDATLYPPPAGSARIEIHVAANLHHAGFILPQAALAKVAGGQHLTALAAVTARFAAYRQLEFGWGDEGFYTRVPTTRELTAALALKALFRPGNATVLHVVGLVQHPRMAYPDASMVSLSLGQGGFERLAAALDASFARSGRTGAVEELGPGLHGPSVFYRATGTFNLLRVCNHWVADLLDAAGVPTAPVLATLPQGLLWDLSTRAGAVKLPPALRVKGDDGAWPISN